MKRYAILTTLGLAAAGLAACESYDPYNGAAPLAAAQPMYPVAPADRYAAEVAETTGAETCFRSNDIRNHTVGDANTLYLKVRNTDVYRLSMAGSCLSGALPSDPIVITSPPTSNIVCRPIDLTISVSKGGFSTACIVQSMVRLTPAEVEALPPRVRP